MHPRWARTVGGMWLLAGTALVLAGIVVVIDQHDLVRWEFPLGVILLVVGWLLWRRRLRVDQHGIEQQDGWQRTRLLWSGVDRVAVGQEGVRGGPVRVWRAGAARPDVLRATWGMSRHQRAVLASAIQSVTGPFDIEVTTDTDPGRPTEATTA